MRRYVVRCRRRVLGGNIGLLGIFSEGTFVDPSGRPTSNLQEAQIYDENTTSFPFEDDFSWGSLRDYFEEVPICVKLSTTHLENTLEGIQLSEWIPIDGHCATRVLRGTDPDLIENRVAFIEKTPRVLHDGVWVGGPKGSGGSLPEENGYYGFDSNSRQWCDDYLQKLGAEFPEEKP